jgi:uncharacterized protein YceH (UPF0502 family)
MTDLPRPLSAIEARVLGTLMEKARTVPDTYPLSLNLVVTGCNQKTSREPVMSVTESEAAQALDGLKELGFVQDMSGSRVTRYQHHVQRRLDVPEQSAVLLGLLLLRGPQTAGELRLNADRWYRFIDISSVEGFLQELAARSDEKGGALTVRLPRAAGAREARWAHLLCGPPQAGPDVAALPDAPEAASAASADSQNDRLTRLEREVAQLRETVELLSEQWLQDSYRRQDGSGG